MGIIKLQRNDQFSIMPAFYKSSILCNYSPSSPGRYPISVSLPTLLILGFYVSHSLSFLYYYFILLLSILLHDHCSRQNSSRTRSDSLLLLIFVGRIIIMNSWTTLNDSMENVLLAIKSDRTEDASSYLTALTSWNKLRI